MYCNVQIFSQKLFLLLNLIIIIIIIDERFTSEDSSSHPLLPSSGKSVYSMYPQRINVI